MPLLYGLLSAEWRGACESLNVRLRDGEQLHLSVLPPRTLVLPETDYRAVLALFIVSIAFLAYLVARMTTRPLKQLAQAAQDLGNDINRAPLDLTGASEIRQASAAFNAMQARIRQYIFQRTQMLAAITHDLQTPLTRMRLRLEKVADHELQERLIGDLSAMQAMVREGPRPGAQHGHHREHADARPRFAAGLERATTPPTPTRRSRCPAARAWRCWAVRSTCAAAWAT
jgi:signal transduction histidine kinase